VDLSFTHPGTGEDVHFHSDPAPDLQHALDILHHQF
jgi:hypothetical protein